MYSLCSRRVGDVFEGGASGGEKACALRKELGDLERVERSLDELIHSSTAQLKQLTEYEDNKRYPLQPVVIVCVLVVLCWSYGYGYTYNCLVNSAVVNILDHTLYVGLCDISRHPLHRDPPRSDSHRRQGPR